MRNYRTEDRGEYVEIYRGEAIAPAYIAMSADVARRYGVQAIGKLTTGYVVLNISEMYRGVRTGNRYSAYGIATCASMVDAFDTAERLDRGGYPAGVYRRYKVDNDLFTITMLDVIRRRNFSKEF